MLLIFGLEGAVEWSGNKNDNFSCMGVEWGTTTEWAVE